ncbi:hypothetical protein JS578_05155 [Dysgonomonadaceae bacterium zrk40]|nr:hypothetical protein JS578_05155 [Dysgonomonadaceae bacterium zrk40]
MARKSKSENAPLLIRLESIPLFRVLTAEEAGEVMFAIFDYRIDGVIPTFGDRAKQMIFDTMRQAIDDDVEAYRERCEKNAKAIQEYWNSVKAKGDAVEPETKNVANEPGEKEMKYKQLAYEGDNDMPF